MECFIFLIVLNVVRYGVIIIATTILGYIAVTHDFGDKIVLVGQVKAGLPTFQAPQFAWGNRTFTDTLKIVAPSVPFIILVASLEAITVAKVFSAQFHYRIIPSQELIAPRLG